MIEVERNENGVPQYPKGHVGRLLVALAAISALDRPTAASVAIYTGLSKSKVTDYVAALGAQLGVTIVKHGSEYKIVSWGDLLIEDGVKKLLSEPINGTAYMKMDNHQEVENPGPLAATLYPLVAQGRGEILQKSMNIPVESLNRAYLDYALAFVEGDRFESVQLIFNGGLQADHVQVQERDKALRIWRPSTNAVHAAEVLGMEPDQLAESGWVAALRKLVENDVGKKEACVPVVFYAHEQDKWPNAF